MACQKDLINITGSGTILTEERTVASFDAVIIDGPINVKLSYGITQKIKVTTDDNITDKIKTEVKDGILKVFLDEATFNNEITFEVSITIPTLSSLSIEQLGNVDLIGFNNLEALSINIFGIGTITAEGSAKKIILTNEKGGQFKGFNFIVNDCEINQSGVGNSEINCQNLLTGNRTGGNIYYKGNPEINITSSGLGAIIDAN